MINTNGKLLTKEKFENLCIAGLDIIKVSCMGWDKESYAHWMSHDYFDQMRETLAQCLKVLKEKKYNTFLQTHHLIQDYNKKDYQLQKYLDNWVNYLGIDSEIWLAHNWSGVYNEDAPNTTHSRHQEFRENKKILWKTLANVIEIEQVDWVK